MTIGRRTAQILLDTGCILLRPDRPFVLTSGWMSPVWLDIPRARPDVVEEEQQEVLCDQRHRAHGTARD